MLFLVHHADAVDAAIDTQRPLSEAGRIHVEQLAARAHDRGVKPAVIWHSGKLRARQTAEQFWRTCNPLAEFLATRGLQAYDSAEWIKDVVDRDQRDIMIVGHMAHIGRLHDLLGGSAEGTRPFPAHGMVALDQRHGRWVELWRE